MNWNGKIIGLMLGALVGGPIGMLIGLIIGHCYDVGLFNHWLGNFGSPGNLGNSQQQANVQQIFFNATFSVMGFIAKSDGRVSEKEIWLAKNIMGQMSLDSAMQQEAIRLFQLGKQQDFDVAAAVSQLKRACLHHPSLLRTFIEIQTQMAYADGDFSTAKKAALKSICQQLGMMSFTFDEFERQYRAGQNYQQYRTHTRQPDSSQLLRDAYQILGVSNEASNAEIKKAYRRLMSQHHPDKLIAKGLPPEMIKLTTQKTQQIKSAYETLRKVRGF